MVIVYTGDGKGKTSAGIGLICRSLGNGGRAAFIQFIKQWQVSEDQFFKMVGSVFVENLMVYKGGKGFLQAARFSAPGVSLDEHKIAAANTLAEAVSAVSSGEFDVVVCDEINNAIHNGLIGLDQLQDLIRFRHERTTLCLTGRDFPDELINQVDIMTNMTKIKHHYDAGYLAEQGIDY